MLFDKNGREVPEREAMLLWADALESGKYKQVRGSLMRIAYGEETTPRYCCLGVLCEVYKDLTGVGEWTTMLSSPTFVAEATESSGIAPSDVAEMVGISRLDNQTYQSMFSSANDSGFSFEQIARVLRKSKTAMEAADRLNAMREERDAENYPVEEVSA